MLALLWLGVINQPLPTRDETLTRFLSANAPRAGNSFWVVTQWQTLPGIPEGEGSDPITEVGLCLAIKALLAKTYPLPISLLVAALPRCASAAYSEFGFKKMLPKIFPRFPEAPFDFSCI